MAPIIYSIYLLLVFHVASSSLRLTPAHFIGYVGASPTFLCNYTSSVGNMSSDVNITWLINDRPIDKASVQTSRFVLQDTVVGLVIEEIPASWNNSYIWCKADTHEGGSIISNLTSIKLRGNRFSWIYIQLVQYFMVYLYKLSCVSHLSITSRIRTWIVQL